MKRSEPANLRPWTEVIEPKKFEAEFWEMAQQLEYTDRNPLNTEMFFLWCLIKSKPLVNIYESGTFKGYSAEIIAKAIAGSTTNFTTIGLPLEDSYEFAQKRLAPYKNVSVIDGNSVDWVNSQAKNNEPCGWWIDGPKGKNIPPLFEAISNKFDAVQWVAVHDAEIEDWSGNRRRTLDFFADHVPITICDESFQLEFSYMDEPLIGISEVAPWYPYKQRGLENTSYGTQTIYAWTEGRPWSELKRI